jgi:putative ABC transport system permease protein
MNNLLPIKLAWNSLFVHKSRTILTIFGIVIGIAAVIIVMSAGESLKGLILGELDAFGSDYIQIEIKVPSTSKNSTANATSMAQGVQITTLTVEDAEAIGKLSNIKNQYSGVIGQSVVSYLNQNETLNFLAVTAGFIEIDSSEVDDGRFFSSDENRQMAKLAVLGSNAANDLFDDANPIGRNIKIGKQRFRVIGVLTERGGGLGLNFDDMVYVPVKTAQKLILGSDHVSWITAQMKNPGIQDQTAAEITDLMRERHEIEDPKDDDFGITTMEEAREMIDTIFGGITLLLMAIAAISLLVGGIGIMNIMYVSVTERTFEIGLRKAVGAGVNQIKWQFLWEAVVVTAFGGAIGVIVGIFLTSIIGIVAKQFGFSWDFVLSFSSILIAVGFSAAVGLIFGYYPAKKAASLDPIEALRNE